MQFLGFRCYFGYILIISAASGLASEPETQSETGEIMVKVFDTHSKYFEDICPSTWFLKLLNSFNLEVIEMDGSIMIFGQNGFLGLNFFTFPGEGGQQYVTMGIMWSSGWAGLLQMIIRMGRPFANDHPDGPAFCKWSSGGASLLQMIIWMGWPFANDHPDWPAFCKWLSGWGGLSQMIIWISWPFANDHLDGPAFFKW